MSPRGKRAAVRHLIATMNLSERFACRMVGIARSTFRTFPADQTPYDPDLGLRTWLCDYAKAHPWWGYRRAHHDARAQVDIDARLHPWKRAHHDARAQGWVVNHKKTQRLCP